MEYNGANYYFEKNILGDIVAVYNSSGAMQGRYTYDAWGNCRISGSGSAVLNANPFRYRGYYYDSESNLYYLQTRYYDPETGRFINADDPSIILQNATMTFGANLFAYCHDNPVMYTDETGEGIWDIFRKFATAIAVTAIVVAFIAGTIATGGGLAIGVGGTLLAISATAATSVAIGAAVVAVGAAAAAGLTIAFASTGRPGDNKRQNEQYRKAMRDLKIEDKTDPRWRQGHDALRGEPPMGLKELIEFLKSFFGS